MSCAMLIALIFIFFVLPTEIFSHFIFKCFSLFTLLTTCGSY